ncbi:MAG: valine--tRNA ligase [bacterium]|nr:valine--tRNA ligase [bacterium]
MSTDTENMEKISPRPAPQSEARPDGRPSLVKRGNGRPYDPSLTEEKIYKSWERAKAFQPAVKKPRGKKSFSIVIPPPNVTGSLHMGHALNASMQDALIRYHRMKGDDTVWIPGMDHASIAIQNVVEKQLKKEGLTRHDLGREKFIERVWEWKEQYGKTISGQLRRIGSSCDWTRERFTLDKEYVRAVQEAFIHYAKKGLIYHGDRIVNWCPRCASSISDLEVKHEERDGLIYNIRYPLSDGSGSIIVATTRTETMLGDTAVAVYPSDERYQKLVGKKIKLPLTNREIPIVADHAVEKEFGTGAVKVTPAHDQTDWEIGERHKLPVINVIGEDGKMTVAAGTEYVGLTTNEAREKVLDNLKKINLLEGDPKKIRHNVSLCDRCNTVIQPLVSKQWFVKMAPLAQPAREVIEKGLIKMQPERWKKISLDWLANVKDWCVSRQLWFGHRLPVWYCQADKGTGYRVQGTGGADAHVVFSPIKPKKCPECGGTAFVQDLDTLDTWFSAALWPFAVFGWPEMTDDFARFYPTSVLATARDIVPLWVLRMIFSGLEFTDKHKYLPAKQYGKKNLSQQIPFQNVIIHPTVLNLKGQRMSKSLGTGIDPMDLINQYGADAVRFGLLIQTQQDQQALRFDENAVRVGRNFANKLWNMGKFIGSAKKSKTAPTVFDNWILQRLEIVSAEVSNALDEFRFGDATRGLHAFIWDEFADWYIEVSKVPGLTSASVAKDVFKQCLLLLHPFMPFVTEELWKDFGDKKGMLINTAWPKQVKTKKKEIKEIKDFQAIVSELRSLRNLLGIPNGNKPIILLQTEKKLKPLWSAIAQLSNFSKVVEKEEGTKWVSLPASACSKIALTAETLSTLPLKERMIAMEADTKKAQEEITKLEQRLIQMGDKAPANIIKELKDLLVVKRNELEKQKQGIAALKTLIESI